MFCLYLSLSLRESPTRPQVKVKGAGFSFLCFLFRQSPTMRPVSCLFEHFNLSFTFCGCI